MMQLWDEEKFGSEKEFDECLSIATSYWFQNQDKYEYWFQIPDDAPKEVVKARDYAVKVYDLIAKDREEFENLFKGATFK